MGTSLQHNSKLMPYLWFGGNAKEAIEFYTQLFPMSSIDKITMWAAGSPFPETYVMNAGFQICGINFYAMDANPAPGFSEGISLFVHCKDQVEVDKYWDALVANGGQELDCGWCKDRFGIRWQIIPMQFINMMNSGEPEKTQRMFGAMMTMKKFVVAELEAAFAG
jgi:predicted 3-demethylubiquinone-9 3-methyltransferase (glyoxalase superfamily)